MKPEDSGMILSNCKGKRKNGEKCQQFVCLMVILKREKKNEMLSDQKRDFIPHIEGNKRKPFFSPK